MKKILTLLFAIAASIGIVRADFVQSVIGPTQTITYHFYTESRTAEVVGYVLVSGSVVIPEQILWADIYYTVTKIGDNAFSQCSTLTSIEMSDMLDTIGDYAFFMCNKLETVTFPFNRLKYIGKDAFAFCNTLNLNAIPSSVTYIGESAFAGCSELNSITLGYNLKKLGTGAFSLCDKLKTVRWNAQNCDDITPPPYGSVSPFGGSITSFIFGNEVKHIPAYLCSSLPMLTSITIPIGVTSIGDYAFYSCFKLDSVSLGNSLTTIGEAAFGHCASLTSVTIPNSVINIGNYAFQNVPNIVFGGTAIGSPWGARSRNGYVDEPLIYNDETRTSLRACSAIASGEIIITNSVTSIEERAFLFCSDLTSVTIPNSVTSIGYSAFNGCSSLDSLVFESETPASLETASAFYSTNDCPLIVPCSAVDAYKTAWPTYANRITCSGIPLNTYTIRFLNWNGDLLSEKVLLENTIPQYLGPTPTKAEDEQYRYSFTGWTPEIVPVTEDAVYTATYRAIELGPITVRLDPQSCADWSVVRLWAWTSEENLFDAWPGIVVSQDADGWYSYTFDESVESVNIIWTDGTNQTVNIEGVTASTCYALNSTSGKTITASVVDCGSMASTYYTIRFLNWDGTVLQDSQVKEGEFPSYTGTTPVRPADEQYTYLFSSWSPAIETATADADYTAQFTATEKTTNPSIPTVHDLATAGYDVANKVVLCFYFDDAPCYDVVIAGTYMADEAGSWITDPEQLVHMAALESFEGWYAAEIPYSENAQGKPIQLKSNGAFSWEYQSGDADAWTNKGGAGSQTATIWAGYNNEANIYYYSPGCYIYELAYWKNHNSPCANTTHNYTLHMYAPNACEEMKPAIIGNFTNWNTGVAMKDTTDAQGKKIYTITIASDEGLVFKFRDASYDNWSNELQEYLSDVKVWATFSNFMIPAATQDTTIVYDFSDNDKYRFAQCEKEENVIVWLRVPTGAPGYYNGAIEMVVYSAGEPAAMPLQYNQEDNLWSIELQAKESDYFSVREANSEDNYILDYVHYYYSDGSDEYLWETWGTTFQDYWENGTGDFAGYKTAMIDLTNPASFKWAVPAIGTGIEDIQGDDVQCTKVLRDGQIYILRGDKIYTLQGQEVK